MPGPTLAAYAPESSGAACGLHSLQVLTVAGGQVTANVVFADPRAFASFELPSQVSAGKLPQPR